MINIEEKKEIDSRDRGHNEKYPWIGVFDGINEKPLVYVLFTAPYMGFRLNSGVHGDFGSFERGWDEGSFRRTDKVFEVKISNRSFGQ